MAKATLIDPTPYKQAGLIPPQKKGGPAANDDFWRKESTKKQLRIRDEQDAITRYKWTNLPCMLSSMEVERLLYYKGQLCLFYMPALEQWYFMPFALDGTIDFYGRYNTIHPVPMAHGEDNTSDNKAQLNLLSTIKLEVLYGLPTSEEQKNEWAKKLIKGQACVIIHDYTRQVGFMNISRQILNDPLLDIMSDCIPFMRTSLQANTGVKGMRIPNEQDYPNVLDANRAFHKAALTGDPYVPIVGSIDFQDLTGTAAARAEEYMLAMQSLDNYRLSLYGLECGGFFQKKEHMLESEQEMNANNKAGALLDGLLCRQYACDILNACLGMGIACDYREGAKPSLGQENIEEELDKTVTKEDPVNE